MSIKAEWAFPFCLAAWLVTLHAGASDDAERQRKFRLLHTAASRNLSPPTPRLDPEQDRQQFLIEGILVDVRTSVVNGHGLRRRLFHGSARNTGEQIFENAILEVQEAQVTGQNPDGTLVPGTFETVSSQFLGDLAPGRSAVVALTLERPDILLRVYRVQIRHR